MKKTIQLFTYSFFAIVSACAAPEFLGTPNPYQGIYEGTETLEGGSTVSKGTYPLQIYINASGRIRIVDVDNISATGQMTGDSFRVVRPSPRMVFEGKVIGKTITGIATQNRYTGDGTFSLTLRAD